MNIVKTDVLVIGGGSGGVAAAVAAGRCGANVMLVERHGAMGGMASASLVHSICGLYLLREQQGAVIANPGFAEQFATRLTESGGAWGPKRMGKVDVLLQHPTAFAWVCDQVINETFTVEPRLHTEVIGISTSADGGRPGGRIESVEISTRGLRQVIEPRVIIDASGDGVAAALAGAPIEQTPAEHLQRPAFIFSLHNVDPAALDRSGRMRLAARIAKAVSHGDLPRGALGAGVRASGRGGEAFVTIDLEARQLDAQQSRDYDPTAPAWLTRLEMEGRELAFRLSRFFSEHTPGFEDSSIAAFPTRVGVRESRRIVGQYQIDQHDLLEGSTFDDAIGLATWPMEMRESARGPKLRFPRENRPCEIPLRALRPPGVSNLLMAGRCISASHEAQASIRVIGTCLVTGEAAGLAAGLQARDQDHGPPDAEAVRSARQSYMAHEPKPSDGHPSTLFPERTTTQQQG